MLRRLRRHRSLLAGIAMGIMIAPGLLGGVAAAPSDVTTLPPPEFNPWEMLPPDRSATEARLVLAQVDAIADLVPEEFRMLTVVAARQYRIDPRLLAAIATVETRWDAHAVGLHGELGLTQILPSTGAWLAREAGLALYDLADPATSLQLSALYLSRLMVQHGAVAEALAAYNGGPGAVETATTNLYARKVLNQYRRWDPAYWAEREQAS